ISRSICQRFPDQKILVIEQDYYYKDQGHLSFEERLQTNYDHPLAFGNDLLMDHVQALLKNKSVDKPVYDYKRHTRSDETIRINPDRKSTRLNSSHVSISYAVFCLKKKKPK